MKNNKNVQLKFLEKNMLKLLKTKKVTYTYAQKNKRNSWAQKYGTTLNDFVF